MLRAELAQRVDQVADRPLVHARNAGQPVVAAAQREHRGQRPERGAGVAEEEVRALHRKRAARARARAGRAAPSSVSTRRPARASAVDHDLRVVGFQHVADARLAARERREQQRAVRDALRSGQPDRAADAADGRQVEIVHSSASVCMDADKFPLTGLTRIDDMRTFKFIGFYPRPRRSRCGTAFPV